MTAKSKDKESGITTDDVAAVIAPGVEAVDEPGRSLAAELEAADEPVKSARPSFGMSQGTREELERTGRATDPFTGATLTRDDLE